MHRSILRAVPALAALLLAACASVPAPRGAAIAFDGELEAVETQRHLRVDQFVDRAALATLGPMALPEVRVAGEAHDARISATQAALVANHAARSVCKALADYAVLVDADAQAALLPRLVVTAINPTDAAAAGLSSVADAFVPGPFRLPAGMGGLSIEAELRDRGQRQLVVMRWSRGANAVTDDARLSRIGDAWQLAGGFGAEFVRAPLDTDPRKAGLQRAKVDATQAKANRALCAARFGEVNLAARGAGFLLPLSPEAMDAGAPAPPTAGEVAPGDATPETAATSASLAPCPSPPCG